MKVREVMNRPTANIDLEAYLGHDAMVGIAERAWRNEVGNRLHSEKDVDRILTNNAYSIVGKLVEEKQHIDLEQYLTEKVGKLLMDENSLKFVLTKDMREYGDHRLGIVLELLENIVKTKFTERLEQVAENIVNSIDFKSKKFQKMVIEEVAKVVAKKLGGSDGKSIAY